MREDMQFHQMTLATKMCNTTKSQPQNETVRVSYGEWGTGNGKTWNTKSRNL